MKYTYNKVTLSVPVDCTQPIWFQERTVTEIAKFAPKQTVDFYRHQDTPVYMCFLDGEKCIC